MKEALGADGHGFLEQHDALVGLVAEELQGGEAAGRSHVEVLPTARGYDNAFCCVHGGLFLLAKPPSIVRPAQPRRWSRAATPSDPTRDRPRAFGRRRARRPARRRAASGRSTEEWPRPRTTAAERRARSRERNAPLRSQNPGPRPRGLTCSRAPSRMSTRRQRAPVRARTILCEFRARGPRIRRPCPSTRSARSALRLPCARPRDSRARALHSSRACTPSMLSSLRASAADLLDTDAPRLSGVRGGACRTGDHPA